MRPSPWWPYNQIRHSQPSCVELDVKTYGYPTGPQNCKFRNNWWPGRPRVYFHVPTNGKILPPCTLNIYTRSVYLVYLLKRGSGGVCALWLVTETKQKPEREMRMWLLEDDNLATGGEPPIIKPKITKAPIADLWSTPQLIARPPPRCHRPTCLLGSAFTPSHYAARGHNNGSRTYK